MRKITEIILHTSATPEGKDFKAADIDRWHRKKGWRCIAYHFFIDLDGKVEEGRPIGMVGAHTKGHNANSIGICYCGGLSTDGKPKDTRTLKQKESMYLLVYQLLNLYGLSIKDVYGHRDFAAKSCPCFTTEQFRKEYGEWMQDYLMYKEKLKED